jgi:signal transduction histidine kinase/ligand-binding sensor domain-containing protein/DNA-binding response OmpR family regulator
MTKYLPLGVLLFCLLFKQAAGHPFSIRHLGINQGLSNNSVRCIYQDRNGFIWFGTYDGLNRYDGYDFKVFRKQLSDTNSLPHNYITAIGGDHYNNVWIGTSQGASLYNNLTGKISPGMFVPSGSQQKRPIYFYVNDIKTDAAGNLFLGTNGGGLLVMRNGSKVAIQMPNPRNTKDNGDYEVASIVIDPQQRVWVFVRELGLCLYNPKTNTVQVVNRDLTNVHCLEIDDQENIWIGTRTGLFKYNIPGRSLHKVTLALTSGVINCLRFDRQRTLWIGTEVGVNVFHPATGKVDYILSGEKKNELAGYDVSFILEDNESRKWIGITKGGVDIIDSQSNGFATIARDPLNPNSLIDNFVSSFYEDEEQNLWIGSDNGGISVWNRRQNSFRNYRHIPGNKDSSINYAVSAFVKDRAGELWIASFGSGIYKFNRLTKRFEHYKCINDQNGEEHKNVWLLYEDREGNLWAATYGRGLLFQLNRQSNRFEPFCQGRIDIFSLFEDHTGTLWAGTSYGLSIVVRQKKTFYFYETGKPVRAILEDKKGRLWIGTEGIGIVLFDRSKSTIAKRFTEEDGLCNNSVLNILEDDQGQLWLSTFHGLSRFDPEKKTFKNYYQEDGLQSNQFAYNAALRLRSGELVFGGIKGFNVFNPAGLKTRSYNPPVLITGLRINNTPVGEGSKYITTVKADKIESLTIPFSEAVVSVDFAALEFSAPGKILYTWYLEGWDKDWNSKGTIRTANYTRLSEGDYVLHIKATNAEAVWNPREVLLHIVVLPPWYRSWWAYAFYLLVLAGAIVLYQRYRANQTKLAFEVRLAKLNAAKERAERETEKLINDQEKEVNEKTLTFFTNISHEFRTPLTLIINPLKDMLSRQDRENKADYDELNIVYRNSRRLLSLVDQLLLFRKTDTSADQLKITKLNIGRLCSEVYLAFVQQAKALKIAYHFECENEDLEIYADGEKMEIIVYNLVSNALKYTPEGGKVVIALTETEDKVALTVSDNGYGIPREVGDKLFERFYQVQATGVPSRPGFGIGLYLVRHFVERHQGNISYESEPGKGTRFLVEMQKGRAHFEGQPVFEERTSVPLLSRELSAGELVIESTPSGRNGEPEDLISEKHTVLLVDDDDQMRAYLDQTFSGRYTVYQAANGEAGVELAYKYLPDIIISDVKMPGLNGIDFCKKVKNDPSISHIPMILLTAESSPEKQLEGMEGGADDYMVKPFEKDLLVAKVANLLKNRTNLQQYFYNEITLRETPFKISEEYKAFLEKCIAVVEKHLDNEDFSVKTLASELSISHSNLYKKVKSISGQTVTAFIRFIRLRKAAELLIHTNVNVNEAASEVGFTSPKYFREQFAKLFGMNPSEYIKRYRKPFGKSYHLNEE